MDTHSLVPRLQTSGLAGWGRLMPSQVCVCPCVCVCVPVCVSVCPCVKGDVDCFLLLSVVSERMTKMLPFRWKMLPM